MFKTVKEAKNFTAHLDALANEIEDLKEVNPEMKKHLALRLDRLADLIESASAMKEKACGEACEKVDADMEKKAYGMGSGTWAQDADEPYMNTFGGTGATKQDADEPYMAQYVGDDHKEVLNRKEPPMISGDGAKVPQPSDNYNEAAVAQQLKGMVQNVMAKMKK